MNTIRKIFLSSLLALAPAHNVSASVVADNTSPLTINTKKPSQLTQKIVAGVVIAVFVTVGGVASIFVAKKCQGEDEGRREAHRGGSGWNPIGRLKKIGGWKRERTESVEFGQEEDL